jgi:GTP-binding nuclear protein Ran
MTDYRILIVGDTQVGKTSYIDHCISKKFTTTYQCTFGTIFRQKYIRDISSNKLYDVTFIDCAGHDKYSFPTAIHKNTRVDGVIIMFQVTSFLSFGSVLEWRNRINTTYGDIPVVLCGNKVDSPKRSVTQTSINFHRKAGVKYYDISVKSDYNCSFPLLDVISQINNIRKTNNIVDLPDYIVDKVMNNKQVVPESHHESTKVVPESHHNSTNVVPESHHESTKVVPESHHDSAQVVPESHHESTKVVPESHHDSAQIVPESHHKSTKVVPESHHESTKVVPESHHESTKVVPESHHNNTYVNLETYFDLKTHHDEYKIYKEEYIVIKIDNIVDKINVDPEAQHDNTYVDLETPLDNKHADPETQHKINVDPETQHKINVDPESQHKINVDPETQHKINVDPESQDTVHIEERDISDYYTGSCVVS